MFNNHKLMLIHDLNQLGMNLYSNNVTVIAISGDPLPNVNNIYDGGILMPPTQVLMNWADGNGYSLQVEYPRYLSSKDPDEFITGILAALTMRDVFIYIPMNEFKIYGNIFLRHMLYMFGISIETPASPFMIDNTKIPLIASKMYMIDVMSAEDFLRIYPNYGPLPQFVIPKLMAQFNIQGPDIEGAINALRQRYHNTPSGRQMAVIINDSLPK